MPKELEPTEILRRGVLPTIKRQRPVTEVASAPVEPFDRERLDRLRREHALAVHDWLDYGIDDDHEESTRRRLVAVAKLRTFAEVFVSMTKPGERHVFPGSDLRGDPPCEWWHNGSGSVQAQTVR